MKRALRGSERIRTAVPGFADRCLSHSATEPIVDGKCKKKKN